jgi:hypothetical protein
MAQVFKKIISSYKEKPFTVVVNAIQKAIASKKIRAIDPLQLILNMLSLCMFPLSPNPCSCRYPGYLKKSSKPCFAARSEEVSNFIINAIQFKK